VALGIAARRELATPLLLTEHGIGVRERYLRHTPASPFARRFIAALTRLWARAGYHHADAIATPTTFNRDWQIALGADPRKIEVVPNGIVLDGRGEGARDGSAAASPEPSSSRGSFTVIAVAAVRPIKDIDTLIRAAAIVTREAPRVRFRVHGVLDDRHYVEQCRRLIEELGLGRRFELQGFNEDRAALYRAADLAVLSSLSEAHPFALLEAMARGVPVVATAVGGVPELLGDAGLLVPPRRPEALAAAILDLERDPGRRAGLGRRGRSMVEEQFSIDRMLGAYDRLYARLIAGGDPVESAVR
jgi:glycosyltransferase involved in cell wall biosynthesis